jgi:hypothetical protein
MSGEFDWSDIPTCPHFLLKIIKRAIDVAQTIPTEEYGCKTVDADKVIQAVADALAPAIKAIEEWRRTK